MDIFDKIILTISFFWMITLIEIAMFKNALNKPGYYDAAKFIGTINGWSAAVLFILTPIYIWIQ